MRVRVSPLRLGPRHPSHPLLSSSEDPPPSFLSSLACPEPATRLSGALSASVCGLLLPQDVHRLIRQIRSDGAAAPAFLGAV